jgi:hypothetical protein
VKHIGLTDLLAITDPAALASEIERRYVTWNCPGCGREVSQRREFPILDRHCYYCLNRSFMRAGAAPSRPSGRAEALASCGCPPRFCEAYEPRAVAKPAGLDVDVLSWDGDPWAVGFLGDSDGGKTMLATELFWRRLPAASTASWITAARLVKGLLSRVDTEREEAAAAQAADLLLIDDLGWGTRGGGMEILFGVITERHAEYRETIWTSNTKWADLVGNTVTGAAFARRLEDGWRVPVKGSWKAAVAAGGSK